MAVVVVKKPDGTEESVDVSTELVIGRAEGSGLVLTEGGVSRKHARLFVEGAALMVEDLGSANGTLIGGEPIAAPTAMGPGVEVQIGAYVLTAKAAARPRPSATRPAPGAPARKSGPRPANAAPAGAPGVSRSTQMIERQPGAAPAAGARRPSAPRPAAGGKPTLKGQGAHEGKVFALAGTQVVGRVAGVELQVEDDSVSRRHAELEVSPSGAVLVRDLGSANGTHVNGERIEGEVTLTPGDLVSFGSTDFQFENGAAAARAPLARTAPRDLGVPTRRGASSLPKDEPPEEEELGTDGGGGMGGLLADPKKKKLVMFGGVGAAVVLLLVVGLALSGPKAPAPTEEGAAASGQGPMSEHQQAEELEAAISECRTYSSTQLASPDWARAEAACQRALEIEPIHPEGNALLRKIRTEREVSDTIQKANKAIARLRDDEAVELFKKIPADSVYYLEIKTKAMEVADRVRKRSGEDCRRYYNNGNYAIALEPCERYATLACQSMALKDLMPAVGETTCFQGRCPKGSWKPRDETYFKFLQARYRKDPNAPAWACPVYAILRPTVTGTEDNAEKTMLAKYKQQYGEPQIAEGIKDYWRGQANEAIATLQKIRSNTDKAQYHHQVDELVRDITSAEQLFKSVGTSLQQENPDGAADMLREALALDEKTLGKDMVEKYSSFFRSDAVKSMAKVAYQVGKQKADRSNRDRACMTWKTGWEFYKGDADLAKAVSACSNWADGALSQAQTCEDLDKVLVFAVDGDGFKERVAKAKAENHCP